MADPGAVRDALAAPRPRADHTGLVLLKDAQPLRQPTTHLKNAAGSAAASSPSPRPDEPRQGLARCALRRALQEPAASRGMHHAPLFPNIPIVAAMQTHGADGEMLPVLALLLVSP